MNLSDFDRFQALLVAASEIYDRVISEGAGLMWWQLLQPYAADRVETAFRGHFADPDAGCYFPKPADIVRRIDGTRTDRALQAWGKVQQALRSVGAYRDVVFDDALIHLAIEDQGGWPKVCRTLVDELSYLQHKFCEAYRAYAAQPPIDYPALLTGDANAWNRLQGRALQPPVLIGHAEAARRVLAQGVGAGIPRLTQATADLARRALAPLLAPMMAPTLGRMRQVAGGERQEPSPAVRAAQLRLFSTDQGAQR